MTNLPEPAQPRGRVLAPTTDSVALQPLRDPYASAGYAGPGEEVAPSFAGTVREYLRIAFKRRWLIAAVAVVAFTFGTVRTLMLQPLYTATVRLQIDRTSIKPVESGQVEQEVQDYDFLRTQYELLMSRSIAERAAAALRLGEDASFFLPREYSILGAARDLLRNREPATPPTGVAAGRERAAAGIVQGNRSIRAVPGSRLVDLYYTDPNPQRAQRIVMAVAEAYIASNLDKRFEANSYAKTFLDDQIKQLKIRLETSEKQMLDFAQKEQIVATTEKASIAETNLASANAALGALISDRIRNEQLWKQVEASTAINLPQLLTNSVIDGLRGRRNALTTEYQEKLETFKPDYPAMVQLRNKMNEIDRQLASEVRTIKSSYKAAYESALKQEEEMRARIVTLKTEALDLQQRSIQYNILRREVDSNRALYESLLQRFKQVDIAGGVGANNVFVVDKAEVPGSPTSPQLSRSMLMSLLMGLGAGFALAFVLEHLDSTIRTTEELERASHLITLGVIPRSSRSDDLLADLDDPRSHLSEAYRSLATALQFSTESGLPRSLLLTSAGPGEGKSTTAVAIARHFSRVGLKVLLIDADLRKPSTHTKLGLDNPYGLSNVLTGATDLFDAMRPSGYPNMSVLTSGPIPPNPADLLSGNRLLSLLTATSEAFNLVVVDGPPVMGIADAPVLGSAAAATLFIAGAGSARTNAVTDALKRMRQSRSHLIGSVLVKYDAKAAGYGYGYGSESHHAGYGYGVASDQAQVEHRQNPAALLNPNDGGQWGDKRR